MDAQRKYLFLFFVSLAFAGGAFFMYLAIQQRGATPMHATVLPQTRLLPDFSLLDQAGNQFNRDSFAGQWSVVFFGFTHCPDICPATLQQLSLARKKVHEAGTTEFPQIVLVSVDPERDSPEILDAYTQHFAANITGVTGDISELRKLTSSMGIFFEKSSQTEDNYGVDHSAVVVLINEHAEFHALFSAPHKVEHFVADIPLIVGSD